MKPKAILQGFWNYKSIPNYIKRIYYSILCKMSGMAEWKDPTINEFLAIESRLKNEGIKLIDVSFDKNDLKRFMEKFDFGDNFYGGFDSGVYCEKIFEHFVSYKFAIEKSPNTDIYIDIAAADSPWVKLLRDAGYNAFAIDLASSREFSNYEYYKVMDATQTTFADESVGSVSLQCAFEMFLRDDDILLIKELHRILKKGGRAIICPFYMNLHYSGYCSPEFWNKHEYHPDNAEVYVRYNSAGIPFSRKYDVNQLQERIINTILANNLNFNFYVLRNAEKIDPKIYCHFILEIVKK